MHAPADLDDSAALLEQVNQALANATPLRIQGANSKAFPGPRDGGRNTRYSIAPGHCPL